MTTQEPNYFKSLTSDVLISLEALQRDGHIGKVGSTDRLTVEPPRDLSHGDVATNAALVLSKQVRMSPRELATLLADEMMKLPHIETATVAGPGFLNLKLTNAFWQDCLRTLLFDAKNYGSSSLGEGKSVNVEYVSTNPTGPMHIGHSRGAIVGDALSRLLTKVGFDVIKEYYVNDAGAQVQALGRSLYARYQEHFGVKISELGDYGGDYLIPVAQKIAAQEGNKWLDHPESEWRDLFRAFAVESMMEMIRSDLALLNIHHDVFTSEKELVDEGLVQEALDVLAEKGLIYEGVLEPPKGKQIEDYDAREQTLFRSTDFGDDVDRALKKSDGSWTYFASDIAYHYDKFKRGASHMINVWGADHGGYVKRLQSAVRAITQGQGSMSVILCQMVKFLEGGQAFKMSKRAGTFISLADALEKVGRDALRFVMLTRKSDAPLDFDFEKVVEQSKDNPVFYVQYASARCHSVLRHAKEAFPEADFSCKGLAEINFEELTNTSDLSVVKLLASWPRQVESAALAEEPHRIAYFMQDVAAAFHSLWNQGKEETQLRFVHPDDLVKTYQRLALVQAVLAVLRSGLDLLGVTLTKEMR